jgi:hypothetical protein
MKERIILKIVRIIIKHEVIIFNNQEVVIKVDNVEYNVYRVDEDGISSFNEDGNDIFLDFEELSEENLENILDAVEEFDEIKTLSDEKFDDVQYWASL